MLRNWDSAICTDLARRWAGRAVLLSTLLMACLPAARADPLSAQELDLYQAINAARITNGVASLSLNDALVTAAQGHSVDMRDNGFLSHTGSDGSSFYDRVTAQGYDAAIAGELVAAGAPSGTAAVNLWLGDAPHSDVLLYAGWQDVGVGYANGGTYGHYWTADFASIVSFGTPLFTPPDSGGSGGGSGGDGGSGETYTPPSIPTGNGCGGISGFAGQTACLLNAVRDELGLSSLLLDTSLAQTALAHSEDMYSFSQLSHSGSDGSSFADRIIAADYEGSPFGEVLCYGCSTPDAAITAWLMSEPHAAMLLDSRPSDLGVGYFEGYWTLDLGIGAVAAVPEPGTYAMLLAGLGLLGFVMRFRKQDMLAA